MVRATIERRKTQTRRIIKPFPGLLNGRFEYDYGWKDCKEKMWWGVTPSGKIGLVKPFKCPYGVVGDILWVRETWAEFDDRGLGIPQGFPEQGYLYKATPGRDINKWKPSIHMPREACRLFLKITDIKIEKLQDITEEDAIKEGVEPNCTELVFKDGVWQLPKNHNCIACSNSCVASENNQWVKYPLYDKNGFVREGEPAYSAVESFESLWDSINNKRSPWSSNPWVWVIEYKIHELKK